MPAFEPPLELFGRYVEIHEPDRRRWDFLWDQHDAIRMLERRAGKHGVPPVANDCCDEPAERFEPRLSVGVGQSFAAMHLRDVLRRMKIIGVMKLPTDCVGELAPDGRLPRPGNAHDDDDARFVPRRTAWLA